MDVCITLFEVFIRREKSFDLTQVFDWRMVLLSEYEEECRWTFSL
jgi:hypothetical protein